MTDRHAIDRSGWPAGPWDDEPDRVAWRHADLPCLMVRHPRYGNWCGYVAVPPGHPCHGVAFMTVQTRHDLSVHGGLSYSGPCDGAEGEGICHVPAPGEPADVWWLGFDCLHAWDFTPGCEMFQDADNVYRDQAWVAAQTDSLADQLAAIKD